MKEDEGDLVLLNTVCTLAHDTHWSGTVHHVIGHHVPGTEEAATPHTQCTLALVTAMEQSVLQQVGGAM